MLKYLVILLCDSSTSMCHYKSGKTARLISIENLRRGLRWAVKRRLFVQVVYPDYELPVEHRSLLNNFSHVRISTYKRTDSDVCVFNDWDSLESFDGIYPQPIIMRTSFSAFLSNYQILKKRLNEFSRVNVVFKDTMDFKDTDIVLYKDALMDVADEIARLYAENNKIQLNLLTDRIMLSDMNNCNAGTDTVTLAPDGNFYLCPAFYYDGEDNIGNSDEDITIQNQQLLKLDHAPVCRLCDAYHCKRCIWMNKKSTLEVNTPGHQQCVMAHVERNAARYLLGKLKDSGIDLTGSDIPEVEYMDPFDKIVKNNK